MAKRFSFNNAKAESIELENARIETGQIINLNTKNATVDWAAQHTGRLVVDVQVMSPYLHYNNGEGFTAMPELGAICALCWPSDGEPPFVLGFLMAPEAINATSVDGGQPQTTTSPSSPGDDETPTDASYRGGRPQLNPGDLYLQGRDENFLVLRRGGVLQIGSTNICQRVYVPVLNTIRDISENWEVNTAAGSLIWQVHRVEDDPSGNAPTDITLISREYAQDKMASIRVSVGSLNDSDTPPSGDKTYIEVMIAPQQIDPKTGKNKANPTYVLRIDKKGNSFEMQAGTRTVEVDGDDVLTVLGNRSATVKKDDTLNVTGSSATTIEGRHSITGSRDSVEKWSGSKVIDARVCRLGSSGASQPFPKGLDLVQWLLTHTHGYGQPPPTQAVTLPGILSTKIFGE